MILVPDSNGDDAVGLKEFNPNHVPGGSSQGGQFAKGRSVVDTSAHPKIRDNGTWGYSHTGSSTMSAIAATVMGIPGYPSPLHGEPADEVVRSVTRFLTEIGNDRVGAEEPLYHGFQNKQHIEFKPGDTLKLPLTATAGDQEDAAGYGQRLDRKDQEGESTVFAFPTGTAMIAYGKWKPADAKEFGHTYSEAIVAGQFTVVSARRVEMRKPQHDSRPGQTWHPTTMVNVVTLRPTHVFKPGTGWVAHG